MATGCGKRVGYVADIEKIYTEHFYHAHNLVLWQTCMFVGRRGIRVYLTDIHGQIEVKVL